MLKTAIFAACFLSVALAMQQRQIPIGERTALALRERAAIFDNLNGKEKVDSMNEMADMFITEMRILIGEMGLDPLRLPDVHKNFSFKPIIIEYHGELDLDRGWAQDVSEVYRNGDCNLDYTGRVLTLEVPIIFHQFLFNYEYNVKLMNLGPDGGVEGKVVNVEIFFSISIDFEALHVTLNKFDIVHIGKITCKFTGNPLFDWLVNILTGLVVGIFKGIVSWISESIVRDTIVKIIDLVNSILANLAPADSLLAFDPVQMMLRMKQN